ncbi:hypothetical protein GIB67_029781 [Kingdonia uniflora]|uniref:Uncharacterized protein n=1 Tax=Kingdonia uniflora TaxID=39325 RepID=A0A7J7NJ69_9MAGN|nr:hypothetical protein GIB67_029781 [Kingdonia uniflora]
MKKQWQVWRGLINRTGHGYDPVSSTFDWTEDVWENIIALDSEAKKYKTAPLQHRDLLEKLFDGLSAIENFVWSSGMESRPSTQQKEYVPLPDDINVNDTQFPQSRVDYTWESDIIPSYDVPISPVSQPTPDSTPLTPMSQLESTRSKGKRSAVAVQPLEPMELVQSLISAFTAHGASSSSAMTTPLLKF